LENNHLGIFIGGLVSHVLKHPNSTFAHQKLVNNAPYMIILYPIRQNGFDKTKPNGVVRKLFLSSPYKHTHKIMQQNCGRKKTTHCLV
jgi:hypothetical protein